MGSPSSECLVNMTEDVTRIMQDYIEILGEKDKALSFANDENAHLTALLHSTSEENKQLVNQLNASVDTLKNFEDAVKVVQDKMFHQHLLLLRIYGELRNVEKLCGVQTRVSNLDNFAIISSSPESQDFFGDTELPITSLKKIGEAFYSLKHETEHLHVEKDCATIASQVFSQLSFELVVEWERRERELISSFGLCADLFYYWGPLYRSLLQKCTDFNTDLQVFDSFYKEEKRTIEERHQVELLHRSRQVKKIKEAFAASKAEKEGALLELKNTETKYSDLMKKSLFWINYFESKADILEKKSEAAENLCRRNGSLCLKKLSEKEEELRKHILLMEAEKTKHLELQKRNAAIILKQEKLAASCALSMESNTKALEKLTNRVNDNEMKNHRLQEELLQTRKQKDAKIKEQQQVIQVLEKKMEICDEKAAQAAQHEAQLEEEIKVLRKQVDKLTSSLQHLQLEASKNSTSQKLLQKAEERLMDLTSVLSVAEEKSKVALRSADDRIKELENEREALLKETNHYRELLDEESRSRLKDTAMAESVVYDVKALLEHLFKELQISNHRLQMERAARIVFEDQQKQESGVVSKLMLELEKAQSEAKKHREVLSDKIRLEHHAMMLEKACKKSAEIIATLRENVAVEQQLSSRFLSNISHEESSHPLLKEQLYVPENASFSL